MPKHPRDDDPAPKLKGRRATVPTLAEFADLPLNFQPKKMNDKGGAYVGIDVNGQWPSFAPVEAPEYMHLLHGKNLYQGASGAARQENVCLAMPLFHDDECTKPTRYKEYLTKFVDKVHAHVFENRVDYLGKKFAKYDEKMTRMAFSDAYKEADDGKPPFLRVVLSDKKDPDYAAQAQGRVWLVDRGNDGLDQEPHRRRRNRARDRGLRRHLDCWGSNTQSTQTALLLTLPLLVHRSATASSLASARRSSSRTSRLTRRAPRSRPRSR